MDAKESFRKKTINANQNINKHLYIFKVVIRLTGFQKPFVDWSSFFWRLANYRILMWVNLMYSISNYHITHCTRKIAYKYIYVYVCIYVYICLYMCVCVYMCICVYVYSFVHIYICTYLYLYIFISQPKTQVCL